MRKENHFLDKQTLIAIALVFFSWLLWERYTRNKYATPETPKEKQEQQVAIKKKPLTKTFSRKKGRAFYFENEKWKIEISSQGLGIKSVWLKKHFDREKKNVVFKALPESFLFELQKDLKPLYFRRVRKTSDNSLEARGEGVLARLFLRDHFIEYDIQVQRSKTSALQIVTRNKSQKGATGFLQSFFGKEPAPSLFAENIKGKKERFYFSEEKKEEFFPKVSFLGFGNRYFGQGFLNQSDISPDLSLKQDITSWDTSLSFLFPQIGNASSLKYKIFFGPKSIETLSKIDPKMVSWIDFGILSSLAKLILKFLKYSFLFTKNWGLSIILLTLIIRLLLFPLNLAAYRSMNVMKKIQPEIKAIREKYKKEPKRMNEETLALMKHHKANPLGGCIPMFLQLPIFFALYRVLSESFELYQSPFIFWIQDLSSKDPFYVLPVFMGTTMFLQQRITPMNLDPRQQKIFRFLPILFTFFMINLPSGLILYIFVSTLFGLIQQYFFTRTGK